MRDEGGFVVRPDTIPPLALVSGTRPSDKHFQGYGSWDKKEHPLPSQHTPTHEWVSLRDSYTMKSKHWTSLHKSETKVSLLILTPRRAPE